MKNLITNITDKLNALIDLKHKEQSYSFFKEEVNILGVSTQKVRIISSQYFKQIKNLDKQEIFKLCEELLKKEREYQVIAFDWLYRIKSRFTPKDFTIFQDYLTNYVSNWASCDDFCCKALGAFIYKYPEFISNLKIWAISENRWTKRAAAVSLIYSLRRKQHLDSSFEMADILLQDQDDLVQKGYG